MSTPKTILLHLDDSPQLPVRLQLARHVAETFDARVTAVYNVLPSVLRHPMASEGGAAAVEVLMCLDEKRRQSAKAAYAAATAGSALFTWVEAELEMLEDISRLALYSDLLIIGQRNRDDPEGAGLPTDFVPRLLVESGRPALVVPYIGAVDPIGATMLVAWKETREAARAVTAALPWLQRAKTVHLVCYGDQPHAPLSSLRNYLQDRGVTATVHGGGPDHGEAGSRLLSLAADVSADLLVMGCYGHSRASEFVFGGMSRTVLQSMTIPVLMVH